MFTNKTCVIVLDIGGTTLKSTLIPVVSNSTIPKECFECVPFNSQGSAEEIIGSLVKALETMFQKARNLGLKILGIGVSTPGPFDFENGISLMKHKFKFETIYGINLKREFIQKLKLSSHFPILFENDAHAFLIGESRYGAVKGYNRCIGLTIGTGVGSAFMMDNHILTNDSSIPPNGAIWCLQYGGSIVDEIISRRGFLALYKNLGGKEYDKIDVKEIASMAIGGDEISLKTFREFGGTIGKILLPIAKKFEAECIVFGGQISKSFSLFGKYIEKELELITSLKKISAATQIDLAPLYGVAERMINENTSGISHPIGIKEGL